MVPLAALLVATAVAYLWDLSVSGYANSFYAAAVQAGTKSWKAFFFGSLDSANFITVDKPPASLWVMELSARIFGFSSLSMLVPEALMGVAAVALLYLAIKRWFGPGAALVAGAALASTPVAALMFRFNNPDALLVLLMTAAAYCVTRAVERAGTRWLIACGALVGLGFLAKMGEALLVVPAFGLAYLVAAPTGLARRVVQLGAGGAALVASAGWWVLIVALWPTGSRPMIDGSPTNSILNLIFAYNGLDRLEGSGGGGGGGGNFSGATGIFRLFNSLMGGQASWLLPAALAALVGGLALTWRAARLDRARAALIVWGGWLVVTGVVFSFSRGVIHTYYTVALAPPIAALVGIGAARLWAARHGIWATAAAAGTVAVTAGWAVALLDRSPHWQPWLRPAIVAAAAVCVVALAVLAASRRRAAWRQVAWGRGAGAMALGAAAIACLAGPVAFTVQTIGTAQTGSLPSAGPATDGSGTLAGFAGAAPGPGSRTGGSGGRPTGFRGAGGPGRTGSGAGPVGEGTGGRSAGSRAAGAGELGLPARSGPRNAASRGAGGAGNGGSVSSALVKLLEADSGHYRWAAATDGSQEAATIELASDGEPVMAIGGFNGEGGNLSLATFEHYVETGDIHYFVTDGSGGGGSGGGGLGGRTGNSSSAITEWVESHFKAQTVGDETIYNLSPGAKS